MYRCLTSICKMYILSRREEQGSCQDGEDDSPFCINPPSSSFDGSCVSLKHSSSVDDIKSGQSYWEKRLQLRHSCTGENNNTFNAVQSLSCYFQPQSQNGEVIKNPMVILTELKKFSAEVGQPLEKMGRH